MTEGPAGLSGVRVSDPRVMRALAHPARIEIIEYLNNTGAVVTATECAGLVGLSPSATSYHLRELAKYGLVEHAPSRGDGRERVWRSTGAGLRIEGDPEQPESRAAEQALLDMFLTRDYNRIREWTAGKAGEPGPWRAASTLVSTQLLLTVEEMAALNLQVQALLDPYRTRERQPDPPAGSRTVAVTYAAFPMPETVDEAL